jgi:deoxyadenosine/deoxycytidine kinase
MSMDHIDRPTRVAVVGVCASGKSTLVKALKDAGYEARHVAQEHSYVPAMWQRISHPDVLIFLDADYETIIARRPKTTLRQEDLVEQNRRLDHARRHCDLYIHTGSLEPSDIQRQVFSFLRGYAS